MNPFDYFLNAFKVNFVNFDGRARRSEFWYFTLFNALISMGLGIISFSVGSRILGNIYSLIAFVPSIAIAIRRLHDIGKSGWFYLIFLFSIIVMVVLGIIYFFAAFAGGTSLSMNITVVILLLCLPLAAIIWFIVMMATDSQVGVNQYGPNPKGIGNNDTFSLANQKADNGNSEIGPSGI